MTGNHGREYLLRAINGIIKLQYYPCKVAQTWRSMPKSRCKINVLMNGQEPQVLTLNADCAIILISQLIADRDPVTHIRVLSFLSRLIFSNQTNESTNVPIWSTAKAYAKFNISYVSLYVQFFARFLFCFTILQSKIEKQSLIISLQVDWIWVFFQRIFLK